MLYSHIIQSHHGGLTLCTVRNNATTKKLILDFMVKLLDIRKINLIFNLIDSLWHDLKYRIFARS